MDVLNYIWYEKYRPRELAGLSLPAKTRKALNRFLKDKQTPHLLLHGPQGSGKTTVANILMDKLPCVTLELNASSEDRKATVMQGPVSRFASSQPPKGKMKIVFLDEADGMTPEAQIALKNTMEKRSLTCRFILTCNHIHKINPAIASRCMIFRFESYPAEEVYSLAKSILDKEDIEYEDQTDIVEVVDWYYPDVRATVNALQMFSISGTLEVEALGMAILKNLISWIGKGQLRKIRERVVDTYNFVPIYKHLFENIPDMFKDNDAVAEVASVIADYVFKDSNIPDRELNFAACCAELMALKGVKIKW